MTLLQPITLETRLPRSTPENILRALDAYAGIFSKACRHYYSGAQKGEVQIKPVFSRKHGLTARQFNAVKVSVDGMIQSQLSNLPGHILQAQNKAVRLEKRLLTNKTRAQQLDIDGKGDAAQKIWRSLPGLRSRLQHLRSEVKRLTVKIEQKSTSICFGSRRLFNAQHHLHANNYSDHQSWKTEWNDARSSQFFVLGSSDETGGCLGCILLPGENGSWIAQLRLPEVLVAEYGKYVYLDGLTFAYQGHLIEQAHSRQQLRSERKKYFIAMQKTGDIDPKTKESSYLEGFGQALSYRFVRDRKGWRVLISTSTRFEEPVIDFKRGAIGVDFNAGFVSVSHLNAAGHKISLEDIFYTRLKATSKQNITAMQALAKQIVTLAVNEKKPIVIESLDFSRKKSSLQKGERGQTNYNAMLSNLSYRQFRQALNMQCLKRGVSLVQVNPAYTSLLGRLKYSRETDFNTHQAAAWVIGRRGMGLKERIPLTSPCRVRQQVLTFRAPVDARKGEQYLKKLAAYYATWIRYAFQQTARDFGVVRRASVELGMIPF